MVLLSAENAKSEDDFAGRERPAPGKYHVIVNHAEEKGSKKKGTPGLEVEFQILAGDTDGQLGKTIPLFLSYIGGDDGKSKTCIDRVTRLALCVGVLHAGEAREPDWQEAIGRELVIEVEAQEYPDANGQMKMGAQVSFMGFWSLGNQAVATVPRDTDSPGMRQLAKAGGPVNRPPAGKSDGNAKAAGNAPNQAARSQTPAVTAATGGGPAAASTAARGKYADL